MRKSITMSGTAVAVAAAWALLPVGSHQAAAQSGQFYVITADVEITPADFDKYVGLAKESRGFDQGPRLPRVQHRSLAEESEPRLHLRDLGKHSRRGRAPCDRSFEGLLERHEGHGGQT
jgi:hypothetical protein